MRRYAARLSCAFFLIGFSVTACPQGNETIEYQPEKVRHLAGVVTYATGETIPGVVVEDCDSDIQTRPEVRHDRRTRDIFVFECKVRVEAKSKRAMSELRF